MNFDGELVLKDFELRALGPHAEVWVPRGDLTVPSEDCRTSNPANLTITDAQTRYLASQFELIRQAEAPVFGVPKSRDGRHGHPELIDPSIPPDAFVGDGERVVILVDNINAGGQVFANEIEQIDRNFMLINAQAWVNRLGSHPANLGPDSCRTFNGYAVPNWTEATVSHEYNHILHVSATGAAAPYSSWLLEGIAMWAESLTPFHNPTQDSIANSPVGCFEGRQADMLPAGWDDPYGDIVGGPSNSLTAWGDPGQGAFCDYGASEMMIHHLAARYGTRFIRDLLYTPGVGLDVLGRLLDTRHSGRNTAQTLQDWSTMTALDGILDDGAQLTGADRSVFQAARLHSTVNFDSPFALGEPGSPANGADYVLLRDSGGAALDAGALQSLRFDAPLTYPGRPVEWIVEPDGHAPGDASLYSGSDDGINRAIAMPVSIEPGNATLSFDTRFDTEPDYDYAFVQVSTDGGATYQSRAAEATTTNHAPDAEPSIIDALPGFNGDSGGWIHQTVDLSDLAGKQILVAFRYMTDGFFNASGFRIDNITMGSAVLSDGSTLNGWNTPSQIHPATVAGINLRLVAYTSDHKRAWVADVGLDANHHAQLDANQLRRLVGSKATTVAAIVSGFEPTETNPSPIPYQLTVNGLLQPGG